MRKFFAILFAMLLTSCPLPAARATEGAGHTLVIATPYPYMAHPQLEYTFLNRYPDGQIVYLEFSNYQDNALQLLSGQMPDLIELSNSQMTRYTNLDLIEDLYERVFPDGFPQTLAPQAQHLMELEGAMIGVPNGISVARWSLNQRYAKQQGFDIPADDWTITDFMACFDAFDPDMDGNGIQDIYFMYPSMAMDADMNPVLTKYVGDLLDRDVVNHLYDIDYFLTDDFLKQLEISKLLSSSDKVRTVWDERGEIINPTDSTPVLFESVGTDTGPYRTAGSSSFSLTASVAMPATCEGERNNPASVGYYSLLRSAPHHDLAVECMQLMASEEYQAIYDGSDYGGGQHCFSAQEPSLQITIDGGFYRRDEMVYSEEYHANVRIVDAGMLDAYHITALDSSPEQYQEQLTFMEQANVVFYNSMALIEINRAVFWPALREYFAGNMTAEEVARLLYQRLRIAMYE